jgi:hypothetical protein
VTSADARKRTPVAMPSTGFNAAIRGIELA